jgi:hypothetical protein
MVKKCHILKLVIAQDLHPTLEQPRPHQNDDQRTHPPHQGTAPSRKTQEPPPLSIPKQIKQYHERPRPLLHHNYPIASTS